MIQAALAHHLTGLGLGRFDVDDTDTFVEDLPLAPVDATGIYAQPGRQPNPFVGWRRPNLQVIVRRAVDSPEGRARSGYAHAVAILAALDDTRGQTWGAGTVDATRIAWCLATQSQPVALDVDETGAPRWSVRFDIETRLI